MGITCLRVSFSFDPTAWITCLTSCPDWKPHLPFQPLSDNFCTGITSYGWLWKSNMRPYVSCINLIRSETEWNEVCQFLIKWTGEKLKVLKRRWPKSVWWMHACACFSFYFKLDLQFWDILSDNLQVETCLSTYSKKEKLTLMYSQSKLCPRPACIADDIRQQATNPKVLEVCQFEGMQWRFQLQHATMCKCSVQCANKKYSLLWKVHKNFKEKN